MTHSLALNVITRGEEIREYVRAARAARLRVGLVPTMGALHTGHGSLVRAARQECDRVVVTIFVNPTQFGPSEDFQKYPRTMADDLSLLAGEGADVVFAPTPDEMYPAGFSTYVEPPAVSLPLEGRCRPGHFRGVATIVLKLFLLAPADVAYFGRKDYQQTLVVKHMVADLHVPTTIRVCPTVREADGLAMSSRNRYLSVGERQQALALSRGMRKAAERYASGERRTATLRECVTRELADVGISEIDYVAIADPDSLEERDPLTGPAVVLVAARVGTTRLIDNLALEEHRPRET